ncbi:MAG TPA: nitrile hydratase subunit alpha [Pseudomonadales bacterium]|nr:nitrile hydratase subunit alpha [Pseudomonadales bacterium]
MSGHDGHDHGHDHSHESDPESPAIRAEALESLLVEKGLLEPAEVDAIIARYNDRVGPLEGARVVARAWVDPAYRARLLENGTAAAAELDITGGPGGQMEKLVVVENTETVHNVVVCTLCSCYPWALLGLPPRWYKDPAYRAGIVRAPRRVLGEFGLELPEAMEIRVWDSSAEVRYLVLPRRPAGSEEMDETALAGLVERDAMIGVATLPALSA